MGSFADPLHSHKRMFCSAETKQKKGSDTAVEVYFTGSRIATFINLIVKTSINMIIVVLLILPVYILFHLTNGPSPPRVIALCMGVLVIFTLAFSAALSIFTRAKPHEILAAAAGYCAVFVVFIGNVSARGGVATN